MTDRELKTLKDNLWHAADVLRSGAHLATNKYGQPILGLIFTMIADAIEYGQWYTGLRTAGAIQSAVTSGQKFGQGIGSALIGFIMSASGYTGAAVEAGSSAAVTISNLYIYGIAILGAIMIFILLFYKLDKEYPQIIKELLEREAKTKKN